MSKQLEVTGPGLDCRTVGQPVIFMLDARQSGPGCLSFRCRAPSGQTTYVLITDNNNETYTADLNVCEPGLHTVDIEWNEEPVKESPFLVRIFQTPDPEKLRVYGPGIVSSVLGEFIGLFHIDTKGSGAGVLNVSIHGPKDGFKVNIRRDEIISRTVNVKYNPTIPGIYTVHVLWSNQHATGSPFEVFLASNKEHLKTWQENDEELYSSCRYH